MTMAIPLVTLVMTCLLMSHANAADGVNRQEIAAINVKLDRLEQEVFFMATTPSSFTFPTGALVFGEVLANTGDGYNPNSGVFTAPTAGLYLLTVDVFSRDTGRTGFELRVNEDWVLRATTGAGNNESNQFVYPGYLKAGDRVYVYNRVGPCTIWGYKHTFFSGVLLKAL